MAVYTKGPNTGHKVTIGGEFGFELDGKVIGYTMIAPTSSRDSYRGVVEVSIFVDQNDTKKGIGAALLSKLMEEADEGKPINSRIPNQRVYD